MNSPLRVVVIDDNADDRSLVARELRREINHLEIEQAHDKASLDLLLAGPEAGLVITDYDLRWTNGLEIATLIKERWPDCPVIMFTGTGNEEVAVQAMKMGLQDYVLKSPRHFARLAQAAKAAVRSAAQGRELREAEKRYSKLFNSIPLGLYSASPTGEILDANPALVAILGAREPNEIIGLALESLFVRPAEYQSWKTNLERQGESPRLEAQLRCRDGRVCWVATHARAIRHPKTQQIIYEGSLEDITSLKAAQQEREDLILELQDALSKVKTLSGLLPICASCKKIRDDHGYWNQIEVYIQEHSDAAFTHSFCPECALRLYPEIFAKAD